MVGGDERREAVEGYLGLEEMTVGAEDLVGGPDTLVGWITIVNSGTGMESLLRLKNVVTFGRAEYNCVANALAERSPLYQDPIKDVVEAISNEENVSEYKIKKFFDGWCKWTIDTSEKSDFSKL